MAAVPLPSVDVLRQFLDLDPETGSLTWKPQRDNVWWNARCAGKPALTSIASKGYKVGRLNGVTYKAHRIIFKMVHGYDPQFIDHVNRDTGDNRPVNLRSVDMTTNAQNRAINTRNRSGVLGVHFSNGYWVAEARRNRVRHYLGSFRTLEEAAKARSAFAG